MPVESNDLWNLPVPFGVDASTGQLLRGLDESCFAAFQQREEQQAASPESAALAAKAKDSAPKLGTSRDKVDDPNNLAETGWAVLFSSSAGEAIQKALEPLLDMRREQAGNLFKVLPYTDKCKDVYQWVQDYGVTLDQPVDPTKPVDPAKKDRIPYYVLIVAPPDEISFEFQYSLDIQWAVGRIWFPTVEEFAQYADSVVRYEKKNEVSTSRQVAVFAPEHELDRATQLFVTHVAKPLVDPADPIGKRRKFTVQPFLSDKATRANLHRIWSGDIPNGAPSLVFTGSHGMSFPCGDDKQLDAQQAAQGAILCQDWEGYGRIEPEHYYAASNLPAQAKVHGMIHFFFACYGAGWPATDNFNRLGEELPISPKPMLARLPQALLAHPKGGALAVIGHVDRAWAYSFRSEEKVAQIDSFRDAAACLLRGDRVGNAMDQFNQRWSILSSLLSELRGTWSMRAKPEFSFEDNKLARKIATQWIARDDARNYIVFGDPAVRLDLTRIPEL